jgi:UDP-N-acetylmuramoyl-tripeptide--D-alanyl-D-alanine ligase
VSIDTRTLDRNELFVALEGERFDGHDFVGQALERGAAACIVCDRRVSGEPGIAGRPLIAVAEPLEALERLAVAHRAAMRYEVTAVTGSFGKTTTKEFLRAILGQRFRVIAAPRSFNNRIGVALTLLAAGSATEHVIAELGTSAAGEISHLSRLVRPERAVITAIGQAHLSGLKDLDGVIAAKTEIFEGLSPSGVAYLNAGLEGFDRVARSAPGRVRTFGWRRGDFAVSPLSYGGEGGGETSPAGPRGYHFQVAGERFFLPVPGRHNVLNAAAAVAVARDLGLTWAEVRSGLLECRLPPRRLQLDVAGGVLLLDDAYNANPSTMVSAMETWQEVARGFDGRRIAVLGDMLEMGDGARRLHEEVGRRLAACQVDLLVTIGSESRHLAAMFLEERFSSSDSRPETFHFPEASHALGFLEKRLRPGDQVLFKGSNRIGVSDLAAHLRDHLERTSQAVAES